MIVDWIASSILIVKRFVRQYITESRENYSDAVSTYGKQCLDETYAVLHESTVTVLNSLMTSLVKLVLKAL
jgi:hypothetical protein